jgi:hypothetical protein
MLTRMLTGCSARTLIDGVRHTAMNFGDVLRGKTLDSQLLEPSLLDSFLDYAIGNEGYLLGHSKACGMISNDDAMMNSDEVAHGDMQNREIGRS